MKAQRVVQISEGARMRRAVILMLASQLVMLGAIFSTYFVPWPVAGMIGCVLYVMLWIAEADSDIGSPITRLMTVFYAAILVARLMGLDPALLVYVPVLIHGVLALLMLGLLTFGKPFVALYSKGTGFYPLQWRLSGMWGVLHFLSMLAAWVLIPDLTFMIVPIGLMILGSFGTIWMSFYSMGRRFDRQLGFEMKGFSFRQVMDADDRQLFYRLVAEAYRADLQRDLGARRRLAPETITREQINSDGKREAALLRFLAFEEKRVVGSICIYFDHPTQGLPIEGESGLDLTNYRRHGRIVEMGKLAIAPTHRLNKNLLLGLFKCTVEAAAQRYVSVIFNNAFAFQQRLYEKIGFSPLPNSAYTSGESRSTGFGLAMMPMVLDLEKMVALDASTVTSAEVRNQLNLYVMERFFKRITVRRLVRPRQTNAMKWTS